MIDSRKKLYETPLGSYVRSFLHMIHPGMPILVCKTCVREDDNVIDVAGDFSVCDRCTASITSKSGVAIRKRVP